MAQFHYKFENNLNSSKISIFNFKHAHDRPLSSNAHIMRFLYLPRIIIYFSRNARAILVFKFLYFFSTSKLLIRDLQCGELIIFFKKQMNERTNLDCGAHMKTSDEGLNVLGVMSDIYKGQRYS